MRFTGLFLIAPLAALCADPLEVSARKVIETQCLSCHGAAKMSGLDLRQRDAMLKGGTRGPALIPGNAATSALYKAVLRDGDVKMPPGKQGLAAAEIEAIKLWIDAGARWSGSQPMAEPSWWSFKPLKRPAVPAGEPLNPIDRFVAKTLAAKGLKPSPAADKRTLIRRATFDLHGLPPTPEEIDAFVKDPAADAYERLIDRLLASPRYGERWGRHWLDVVRYADTGGFETDVYLSSAWRYRDYVIRSFNNDKPYDVFVKEQIAADEIWPDNLDLEGSYQIPKSKLANLERRLGTALYTLGALPVENSFFGDQYRSEWQAEAVETTAAAFMGLTFACARCHDHKFDPISQRDFYRLSAVFGGSEDREVPITSQMGIFEFTRHQTRWVIVDELKARVQRLDKKKNLSPAERDERETLLRQIGDAYMKALPMYPKANLLAHTDPVYDTHLLIRGDWQQKGEKLKPGFPAALGAAPAIDEPDHNLFIPRRRKALAEWLASPQHPLTARVMVNRIWQGHFDRGIVGSPNDFGRQGEAPTHPELLDWLASEFIARGWSMKQMHKLILLSDTYRRSSEAIASNLEKDADNRYLWRMNRKRMEAEVIRDSVLAVAGTLNAKMFGTAVVPELAADERDGMRDMQQWPITSDPAEHTRRSVYLFMKRSFRNPMLETFDAPDAAASCARRESSTVAPQSLAMMNSDFMTQQAAKLAARVSKDSTALDQRVVRAFQLATGRTPDAAEREKAVQYASHAGLAKYCLLLFNLSEFLYVD